VGLTVFNRKKACGGVDTAGVLLIELREFFQEPH
jgi:hypothetical protein